MTRMAFHWWALPLLFMVLGTQSVHPINLASVAVDAPSSTLENRQDKPTVINGTVTDYYAGGMAVVRGQTNELRFGGMSTSHHPLSQDETRILSLDELAILPDSEAGWIIDDAGHEFGMLHQVQNVHHLNAGFRYWHSEGGGDLTAGDFDGDCLDELLVADSDNIVYLIDNGKSFPVEKFIGMGHPDDRSVTAGDFDGDGIDEFALLTEGAYGSNDYWLHLSVWDVLDNASLIEKGLFEHHEVPALVQSAAGDFDGDGADELVVGYWEGMGWLGGCVEILDSADADFAQLTKVQLGRVSMAQPSYTVNIVTGDFDGDQRDEIAAVGDFWIPNFPEGSKFVIIDDAIELFPQTTIDLGDTRMDAILLAAGDVDGDGRHEMGLFGRKYLEDKSHQGFMFELSPTTGKYENTTQWPLADFVETPPNYEWQSPPSYKGYFTMGDLDCDGRDELVFSGFSWTRTTVLDDAAHNYAMIHNDSMRVGAIVCGDFDGDGVRLKYTGEAWTNQAPPGILVVLAAPPTYKGIAQNYVASYTAYGAETSVGHGEGNTIGTSVATTYSFEYELDFDVIELFRYSMSRTITEEFARTKHTVKTQTVSGSYATGVGNDSVIYHLTTYNCYKYEITFHPFDESLIGTYMTIDVPNAPLLYQAPISYFNKRFNPDIGVETFNHTVGRPWTYPSKLAMLEIASYRWQSGEMTVGIGDGFNKVEIRVEEEDTTTMTTTESSEYAIGGSVAGAGYTYSWGAFTSKAYEIITGRACVYEGVVGQIANETLWEQLNYTFGLFVSYLTHPKGHTYQVVNYYVEGAVPYGVRSYEKIWDFFRQRRFLDLEFWKANPLYVVSVVGVLVLFIILLRPKGKKRKRRSKK